MERLAEKLLNATGRLFKSAMMVAVALVGLFIAILTLTSVYGYYTVTVPTSQVRVTEFMVRHKACSDPQYPLYVKFKNESNRTVLAINFSFKAYIRGRSTDIAEYNSLRDDTILKPGDAYSACWALPELKEEAYAKIYSEEDANSLAKYAEWLRANMHNRGKPEFETVAEAYRQVRTKAKTATFVAVDYRLSKSWVEFQN